jgi:hypothetical protein
MHHARSFLTVLFLVGSLAGTTRAIAAEGISPPSVTSHEVNVLRQVAAALVAGNHAIRDLRGPPIEHSNLDRPTLPRQEWIAAWLEPLCLSYAAALRSIRKKPRLCSLE